MALDHDPSRRDFLKKLKYLGIFAWWVAVGGVGKSLLDLFNDNKPNKKDKTPEPDNEIHDLLFDKKHYLDISGNVKEPYMDHGLLLEEMPTVYDNILYAKELSGKNRVEDTIVYKNCVRMQWLEAKINYYAKKYNVPAEKLLGLIFVESEDNANVWNPKIEKIENGKKKLCLNHCYGYTQISVLVWMAYWAIQKSTKMVKEKYKSKWKRKEKLVEKTVYIDKRNDIDVALETTCKFFTDIRKKWQRVWYTDDDRSITFAAYHMWETHMNDILRAAKEAAKKTSGLDKKTTEDTGIVTKKATENMIVNVNNMQDIIGLNDKKVGNIFMELRDESYKYYPKLLAAWRIYDLFKWNREQFNHNVQAFIDSPVKRKPSLSEEFLWYGLNSYYKTNTDLKDGMKKNELFGIKNANKNVQLDNEEIGIKNINHNPKADTNQKIDENDNSVSYKEQRELMKMSSKASRWLIKFISHYYAFNVRMTSLTRSEEYNDALYKAKDKRTSHATGYALDIWFPKGIEDKRYFRWILYGLEVQGKIAFLEEKNCFHVIINPKYKQFFENIAIAS